MLAPSNKKKPYVLIVLDGFGYRSEKTYNAIAQAQMPTWNRLWETAPHTLLAASGPAVGLAEGQMGNSEVGHLNLGAGRILYQGSELINQALAQGEQGLFFQNPEFKKAIQSAKIKQQHLHIMILLSPGGVHSHESHLFAFLRLCQLENFQQVLVHAFLDGRDTPPKSAQASLEKLENLLKETKAGRVASLMGRYFAMDRDKRWERTALAYTAITQAKAPYQAASSLSALAMAYARQENDEFVKPTIIGEAISLSAGDSIVFLNFRADRARQLSQALFEKQFTGFERAFIEPGFILTLSSYYKEQAANVAFEVETPPRVLGEYIQELGLSQLRIAETEKYAHVTFFFNGGLEAPFTGEERILIPSPKVNTYDLAPEMSAPALTKALVEAIYSQKYDLIVCNFANPDMVGHTGLLAPTLEALACIDRCLAEIIEALLSVQGEALITADHGNAELMYDEQSKQAHTAHTLGPVPLVYVGSQKIQFTNGGVLANVAPTLLELMHLAIPKEMSAPSLLAVQHEP
jgi:2,3-bisphosphoglycerate-independent phosphoglycerate mutase